MKNHVTVIFLLIVLAHGPPARAQDAWGQRLRREQACAVYPQARGLVETHGDAGVRALFACTYAVAIRLCEFHNCGILGALPDPQGLLMAIGQHGDPVAWFIMHHPELRELDVTQGFLLCPLEVSLNVCSLDAKVAEVKVRRMEAQQYHWVPNGRGLGGVAGIAIIIGLIVWWKRRRRGVYGAA
jgi:hypothetical protein